MIFNSLSNVSFDHNHNHHHHHTNTELAAQNTVNNRSNIINMVTTDANFIDKKSALMGENSTACFLQSSQNAALNFGQPSSIMKTIKPIHKHEQSNEDDHKQSQQQQQMCKKCHLPIDDRYIFNVKDAYWHEECLKCFQCGQVLRQKCYETDTGALYCKEDFIRFAAF
jgi:hypothetical protein